MLRRKGDNQSLLQMTNSESDITPRLRVFAVRLLTFLFVMVVSNVTANPDPSLQPIKLTCEYQVNPLGIDTKKPRLSWIFQSTERNQFQSAYEIIVSTNQESINHLKGDAWSTGKISSGVNLHIEYSGEPLKSFIRYYWKVRVYDKNNKVSEWSNAVWFETAMLEATDWKSRWIGDGSKQFDRDEDFYKEDRMPLFRKVFAVKKKVSSARLYITGMGYYEAYINGKKIGDHVLAPGWTTYKKEVLYVTHDITSSLLQDANVVGVMLGNGWWNPLPIRLFGRFNLRDEQQTGRPCVKAEVHIQYADGAEEIIATDETWQSAPGPVVRNNVFLGEQYDARLEQKNWNTLKANKSVWKNALLTEGPAGAMHPQMQPPIKITKVIQAVSIVEQSPGVFIADMGQNFAGVARIKVQGKSGTKINLRYGEALHPEGTLNYLTTVAGQIKEIWHVNGGPGSPATAWQEDSYILAGTGLEIWSPRFTFHGFRYVQITGWPGKPSVNDLEGLRMNSDLEQVGEFSSSNEMFNKIHKTIQWTFLSNVFSVQSDCPGREKMGYGADMVTTANAFLYNYDMSNFYSKSVKDFANEQQLDGGITEIAPYTGIADRGLGGESGPLGWQLAFPYLQKQLYEFYGDKRIIAENYDAFTKQMDFLKSKAVDGLFHWDISDHEAIDPKPEALSAAAFYYHHTLLATEFAGILGKSKDSARFAKLGLQIKKNIIAKYLIPNTGRFDNATQSAQLFALWYDFTPEKEKSFEVLMKELERHQWHVSSGIYGVTMMFDWLRKNNHNDVAYRIANQKDYPGWGYMLDNGATTLWESWKYPDNGPSQNHPMFGSIDEWFYRSLLGINSAAPGFKKIIIKPQPAGDLTWARGSHKSVAGKINSDWKLENNFFSLKVSIPFNCQAEVWIPSKPNGEISESGKPISTVNDVRLLRYLDGYALIEVGSGEYTFGSELK